MAYFEGEIPTVVSGNNGSNSGFGGWGDSWVAIILFAMIFGWGRGGYGFGGGDGGRTTIYETGADVQRGFDTATITSKLNAIENGLCDGFYAQNTNMLNGFAGVQQTLCQGFAGVNSAIVTNGYETRGAITDLGYRLQDCCCQTQRAIDAVNYNMATNTCAITNALHESTRDIIDSQRAGTSAILNYLTTEKISSLQAENAQLTAQLSQNAQTRTILDTLRPVAQPAYLTCSPYESMFGFGRSAYVNSCGCGCGC